MRASPSLWPCASTTPSRNRWSRSRRSRTIRSACTPAGRRSTTTPTSATSAPSSSTTSCAAGCARAAIELDHVMNITDVDDKIIRNAVGRAPVARRVHRAITPQAFLEDCATLRLEAPGAHGAGHRAHPRNGAAPSRSSTRRGYTYDSDGSVYYRISKFPEYGKLSHNDFSGIRAGARVDVDEYDKADARDFVLWKAPKDGEPFWDGADRPGPPRLAHRVLRDGHEVSGRDARHPRRRRRSDLPASRKRNRAIGSAHRQAVRALLAAFRIPAWSKGRRCRSRSATSTRCAICWSRATRPKRCATCWRRCRIARSSTSPSTD